MINIWDIKGSGMRQNESEYESTFQTIVFNQLLYYIHNMKLLNVSNIDMSWIAKKFIKTFSLSKNMSIDI